MARAVSFTRGFAVAFVGVAAVVAFASCRETDDSSPRLIDPCDAGSCDGGVDGPNGRDGGRDTVPVDAGPTDIGGDSDADASLDSDDGIDAARPCPIAKASARVENSSAPWESKLTTAPRRTVALSSKESFDSDGSIVRYEWSIVQRPKGSRARLTPKTSVADPKLHLDLVGTYEVALTVHDDDDNPNCGRAALVTIEAVPEHDVYIEMFWDTPADTNQRDSNGADVDLHYFNPRGSNWNEKPWDIFWDNKKADWGIGGDPSDDPAMPLDDKDGAGPEVIVHDKPRNRTYHLATYYYDDHGFGPSYATTRVYYRKQLAGTVKRKSLSGTFVFHHGLDLQGATGKVTKTNNKKTQGFPNPP